MKKFLKKSLIYLVMTMLVIPATLVTSALSAQKVRAAGTVVIDVTSGTPDGYYMSGDTIDVSIQFTESVFVTGSPQVSMDVRSSGRPHAIYATGTGTDTLHFNYLVADGDNSLDLNYYQTDALSLNGGAVKDSVNDNAVLTLPTKTLANSLAGNKNIVIDTVAPLAPVIAVTNPVNSLNQTNVAITGTGEADSIIVCAFVDENSQNIGGYDTVQSDGNINITGIDLSGLADGVMGVACQLADGAGNAGAVDGTVIFKDTVLPVITLTGPAEVDIFQGEVYVDAGATATDNIDGDITSSIVPGPSIDSAILGTQTMEYSVSDSAGNISTAVRTINVLEKPLVIDLTAENPTYLVSFASPSRLSINVPSTVVNPVIDLSLYPVTSSEDSKTITLIKDITINSEFDGNNVIIVIPAGETITGPADWDGLIYLPSIIKDDGKLFTESGTKTSDIFAIQIGLADDSLVFGSPVKIILGNQANKKVGFVNEGVFTEISTLCDDVENPTNFANPLIKECKINSADGKDLVIWTTHFTEFVSYNNTVIIPTIEKVLQFEQDGQKFISVTWTKTGASSYQFYVDGIMTTPVSVDGNIAFLRVNSTGKHIVNMKAIVGGVPSEFSASKEVIIPKPIPVAQTSIAPIAPQTAQAATNPAPAPEQTSVETPKDDQGVIKGDDTTNQKDETNWTPWIILFVLILFAGAATGGYFYWFAGKDEETNEKAPISKIEKKSEAKVTVRTKSSDSNKKSKRW